MTRNENCLAGIACPKCGSPEPFHIVATAQFVVFDSGTDEYSDVEWDDDSLIACPNCGHSGTVIEFRGGSL